MLTFDPGVDSIDELVPDQDALQQQIGLLILILEARIVGDERRGSLDCRHLSERRRGRGGAWRSGGGRKWRRGSSSRASFEHLVFPLLRLIVALFRPDRSSINKTCRQEGRPTNRIDSHHNRRKQHNSSSFWRGDTDLSRGMPRMVNNSFLPSSCG